MIGPIGPAWSSWADCAAALPEAIAGVGAAWDLRTRTIPTWVAAVLAGTAAAAALGGMGTWSWGGAGVAAAAGLLAGLPRGDVQMLVVLGAAAGADAVLGGLLVLYAGLIVAFLTIGRAVSLIGYPLFPYIAACVLAARWLT